MSKTKTKTTLISFFGLKGIIHCVCPDRADLEVLKQLKRKRSEIKDSWKLYHDNAPSNAAFIVNGYLAWVNIAVWSRSLLTVRSFLLLTISYFPV